MANHIDAANYAVGITLSSHLPGKKITSEKEKKTVYKFKDILKNLLPAETASLADTNVLAQIMLLPEEEAIPLLQDAVCSAGDMLKMHQNMETIAAYKQAIKNFMTYIAHKAYAVITKNSIERDRNNKLKRRIFTQVIIINEKLDKFTSELLYNQKNQLFILERVEEIYGLLVDLIT